MAEVYISHAPQDREFASRLKIALAQRQRDSWVAGDEGTAAEEALNEMERAIDEADACIFILSPEAVKSRICQMELAHALQRQKRLVPVLHKEVDPQSVPEGLSSLHWLFFREGDDFQRSCQSLIQTLNVDLEWVKAHTGLLLKAIDWERGGGDRSLLLRGAELAAAEGSLAESALKEPRPTDLQRAFVAASRRAAVRNRRAVRGVVAASLVAALILTVVAVRHYYTAGVQNRLARSRSLAAQSRELLSTRQTALALLLSLEALRLADTVEARGSLLAGLQEHFYLTGNKTSESGALQYGEGTASLLEAPRRLDSEYHYSNEKRCVVWSPDGKTLATSSPENGIVLWDLSGGRPLVQPLKGPGTRVSGLAFIPDGRLLASLSSLAGTSDLKSRVTFWDLASRAPTGNPLDNEWEGEGDLAFSPDGTALFMNIRNFGAGVGYWRLGGPVPPAFTAYPFREEVRDLVYSPKSGVAAAVVLKRDASDPKAVETIVIMDLKTGKELGRVPLKIYSPYPPLFLSREDHLFMDRRGKALIAVYGKKLQGWDLSNLQPLDNGAAEKAYRLLLSHDGKQFAVQTDDRTVVLRDAATGQQLDPPLVDDRLFNAMNLHRHELGPDGQTLYATHYSFLDTLAPSPDGKKVAIAVFGGRGGALVLDVDVESWKAKACRAAGRNLTREEWRRYLGEDPYRRASPER